LEPTVLSITNPDAIHHAIRTELKEALPEVYATQKKKGKLDDYIFQRSAQFFRRRDEMVAAEPESGIGEIEERILRNEIFVES
jgi:hypothetical protein